MACTLCVFVVALPLVVPVGAAVVRVAVWLANRVLKRPRPDRDYGYAVDDDYLPPWNDAAVPQPEFWKAAGITVAVGLAELAVCVGLVYAADHARGFGRDERRVVFGGAALVSAFLIQTGLLKLLLPTTFPRACLVAALVLLLAVPVVFVVGGIALVGLNAIAPNMGR